jgi:hypothetical protein
MPMIIRTISSGATGLLLELKIRNVREDLLHIRGLQAASAVNKWAVEAGSKARWNHRSAVALDAPCG